MPAKHHTDGAVNAAGVNARLPQAFFVMRGHIRAAFQLTEEEMKVLCVMETQQLGEAEKAALTAQGKFVAEYPVPNGRARFVRSRVMQVARKWEGTP